MSRRRRRKVNINPDEPWYDIIRKRNGGGNRGLSLDDIMMTAGVALITFVLISIIVSQPWLLLLAAGGYWWWSSER